MRLIQNFPEFRIAHHPLFFHIETSAIVCLYDLNDGCSNYDTLLFFISSAVQKCMPFNNCMTKVIQFMYMISVSSIILPCISSRPSIRSICLMMTCLGGFCIVMPIMGPIFAPNMSSAQLIYAFDMGNLG